MEHNPHEFLLTPTKHDVVRSLAVTAHHVIPQWAETTSFLRVLNIGRETVTAHGENTRICAGRWHVECVGTVGVDSVNNSLIATVWVTEGDFEVETVENIVVVSVELRCTCHLLTAVVVVSDNRKAVGAALNDDQDGTVPSAALEIDIVEADERTQVIHIGKAVEVLVVVSLLLLLRRGLFVPSTKEPAFDAAQSGRKSRNVIINSLLLVSS